MRLQAHDPRMSLQGGDSWRQSFGFPHPIRGPATRRSPAHRPLGTLRPHLAAPARRTREAERLRRRVGHRRSRIGLPATAPGDDTGAVHAPRGRERGRPAANNLCKIFTREHEHPAARATIPYSSYVLAGRRLLVHRVGSPTLGLRRTRSRGQRQRCGRSTSSVQCCSIGAMREPSRRPSGSSWPLLLVLLISLDRARRGPQRHERV